jgi:hypothetical protein
MNAKEMFKKLGYIELEKSNSYVVYNKFLAQEERYIIEFHNNDKTFSKYKNRYGNIRDLFINFDEFKAIQKQIEELGWESDKNVND